MFKRISHNNVNKSFSNDNLIKENYFENTSLQIDDSYKKVITKHMNNIINFLIKELYSNKKDEYSRNKIYNINADNKSELSRSFSIIKHVKSKYLIDNNDYNYSIDLQRNNFREKIVSSFISNVKKIINLYDKAVKTTKENSKTGNNKQLKEYKISNHYNNSNIIIGSNDIAINELVQNCFKNISYISSNSHNDFIKQINNINKILNKIINPNNNTNKSFNESKDQLNYNDLKKQILNLNNKYIEYLNKIRNYSNILGNNIYTEELCTNKNFVKYNKIQKKCFSILSNITKINLTYRNYNTKDQSLSNLKVYFKKINNLNLNSNYCNKENLMQSNCVFKKINMIINQESFSYVSNKQNCNFSNNYILSSKIDNKTEDFNNNKKINVFSNYELIDTKFKTKYNDINSIIIVRENIFSIITNKIKSFYNIESIKQISINIINNKNNILLFNNVVLFSIISKVSKEAIKDLINDKNNLLLTVNDLEEKLYIKNTEIAELKKVNKILIEEASIKENDISELKEANIAFNDNIVDLNYDLILKNDTINELYMQIKKLENNLNDFKLLTVKIEESKNKDNIDFNKKIDLLNLEKSNIENEYNQLIETYEVIVKKLEFKQVENEELKNKTNKYKKQVIDLENQIKEIVLTNKINLLANENIHNRPTNTNSTNNFKDIRSNNSLSLQINKIHSFSCSTNNKLLSNSHHNDIIKLSELKDYYKKQYEEAITLKNKIDPQLVYQLKFVVNKLFNAIKFNSITKEYAKIIMKILDFSSNEINSIIQKNNKI